MSIARPDEARPNSAHKGHTHMTKQERFFYDNAGTCQHQGESLEQAKLRGAKELALAETWLAASDKYDAYIHPDSDADESFMDDESEEYKAEWSGTAWFCTIENNKGHIVASLSGCYGDSDYERLIKAELALEVMRDVAATELKSEQYAETLTTACYC